MAPAIGRCLAAAAAIPMMAGVLSLTSAWVFYQDDRERSHATMVGTLEIDLPEGRGLGTAVLVDGCGILTNFHAVFGPWYVTALRAPAREYPGRFTLTEALRPDGTPASARAIPVIWGDYRGPDRQFRAPHQDWAYLVLDECLGLEYGHFWLRDLDLDEPAGAIDGFAAIRLFQRPAEGGSGLLGAGRGRAGRPPELAPRLRAPGRRLRRPDHPARHADGGRARRGDRRRPGRSAVPGRQRRPQGAPLAQWSTRCANVAVPLTQDIIDRVRAARIAVGVQRTLIALGYDAAARRDRRSPASAAIGQAQREMGWPATGEPSHGLWKILMLRLKLMVS